MTPGMDMLRTISRRILYPSRELRQAHIVKRWIDAGVALATAVIVGGFVIAQEPTARGRVAPLLGVLVVLVAAAALPYWFRNQLRRFAHRAIAGSRK